MALLDIGAIHGRARHLRERCGYMNREPPYSMKRVMTTCFPKIAVTGADLPKGIVEMTENRGGRRTIFYKRSLPHDTQRVGIAHGLYHLLTDLKADAGMAECNTRLRWMERATNAAQDPIEVACDLFAAALLCPPDVLDRYAPAKLFPRDPTEKHLFDDEVDNVASRFNVPKPFMRWCLYDLMHLRRTHAGVG